MIHANGSVQSNRDPLHAVADVMVGHTPPGCYLPLPPLLALSTLPYPTSIILGCMPQCPLYDSYIFTTEILQLTVVVQYFIPHMHTDVQTNRT